MTLNDFNESKLGDVRNVEIHTKNWYKKNVIFYLIKIRSSQLT